MLLTPDTRSPAARLARHDSVFVLVLALTLVLATSTFFGPFSLPAIVLGLLLSVALHRWSGDPAGAVDTSDDVRLVPINFSAVHVGGDAGGLIFVLGSLAILALGLPTLRWFLIASVLVAAVVAYAKIAAAATPRTGIISLSRHITSIF
jgi:hypothetical protein